MHGPATVGWLLVALCAAAGACCALRARDTTGTRREEAVSEALMCLGMTAMALPDSPFWSPAAPAPTALYVTLFAAVTAWELRLLLYVRQGGGYARGRRPEARDGARTVHLHHAVGALAMLYMAGAMVAAPAHSTAGFPLLTGALLVYFALYVLRSGARLMPGPAGTRSPGGGAVLRQPGVVAGVRLAMGAGMFAMLLTL